MALPNYKLTGNRSAQPVYVEDATSAYRQKTLSSISAVYGTDAPPSIIISLRAGVFARAGSFSRTYFQLSKCSSCPAGMTSLDGAKSAQECFCGLYTYYNYATGKCEDVRTSCGENEFISRLHTPTSDTQCRPCPMCPLGFYRDTSKDPCLKTEFRDPAAPPVCLPCDTCSPGSYIDPSSCWLDATSKSVRCIPCGYCPDMHNIVGTYCPGTTRYNTQSCQKCTASCPDGMYISDQVQRCNGKMWTTPTFTSDAPFDASNSAECVQCGGCPG